jgi:hypothetical protein
MTDFIEEAGWGIYPVLIFGLTAFAVALWQVVLPRKERVTTATILMALTATAGVLGTAIGVQTSVRHITGVASDDRWIFLVGLRESLNNLVAALILMALTMLLLLGAHMRQSRRPVVAERKATPAEPQAGSALLRAV